MLDELFADCQSQAGAFALGFCCIERLEYFADISRQSRSGIGEANEYLLMHDAGGDSQSPAGGHGIDRVLDEIAAYLKEFGALDGRHLLVIVKSGSNEDAVGVGVFTEGMDGFLDNPVDISVILQHWRIARELEKISHSLRHAHQSLPSFIQILVHPRVINVRQYSGGEVDVAECAVEGVVQFVGDAGGEFADSGHAFGSHQPSFEVDLVSYIVCGNNQARSFPVRPQREWSDVDVECMFDSRC